MAPERRAQAEKTVAEAGAVIRVSREQTEGISEPGQPPGDLGVHGQRRLAGAAGKAGVHPP
jgi:hypothetical protein